MDAETFYHYLIWARRRLWDTLRALPDEELSRPVLPSDGARGVKDLLHHVAVVEDGWVHASLFARPLVLDDLGRSPRSADEYWHHEREPLDTILAYHTAVEADTLRLWPDIMEAARAGRRVEAFDDRPETLSADEVIWHVMQHEVRHTAQIVLLLRLLGHTPPALDLAFQAAR